jgi:hypothetical protein
MTFVGAPEAPFNTVVITRQYDGIADWPAQQLNVLADVNAVLGAVYLHDQSNYAVGLDSLPAGSVTTTTNSFGATTTTYLIPYPGLLPILRPFQELGVDERLLDTIQVPLKRVIDSAYTTPSWGRARTVAAAAGQKALKAVVNTVSHVVSAIAPSAEKPNGVLAAESSPGPLVPARSSSRHDSSAKLIPRKRFPGPSRKRSEVDPEPNSARTGPRPNILALRTQLRHSVDAQSHGVTKAAGSDTGRHGRHRSSDASNGPA